MSDPVSGGKNLGGDVGWDSSIDGIADKRYCAR